MNLKSLEYTGKEKFSIKKTDTKIKDLYESKEEYETLLADLHEKLDDLQSMMYAHNRYGVLVIFQAKDAAGKDSTIKAVFSGVNPAGLKVVSFKRPSETELDHDFLWRTNLQMPERGTLTVFNRSYYEEVLVCKVHPEIVQNYQRLPENKTKDMKDLWQKRYEDIANMEKYLHHNGIAVVKFFLNVSKEEQGNRLIERIQDPTKNWKFEEGDLKERALWKEYDNAYEDCINATATENAPWYVIPADDKKNMRLLVCQILEKRLKDLDMSYPEANASPEKLQEYIKTIQEQNV